ncbi:MAG: hypothetical protein MHPSP_000957, partial [Paramarteilia canceri]
MGVTESASTRAKYAGIFSQAFGASLVAGGIGAYMAKRSKPSLISGTLFGLSLIATSVPVKESPKNANIPL